MDLKVFPGKLHGSIAAIPSKSMAHRLLICAAFADKPTQIRCGSASEDIDATVACLCALGAQIIRTNDSYFVTPISSLPAHAKLYCRESGSTLRFILPIVCALGVDSVFYMDGRLPERPLSPLWEELKRMGCTLSRPTKDTIHVTGKLQAGTYNISGDVSSQFISGLLLALSLLNRDSQIHITTELESRPYVDMTLHALSVFGINIRNHYVRGGYPFTTPGIVSAEGDWSNAAFYLVAKYLGSDLEVTGLDSKSPQGDRAVASILKDCQTNPIINVTDIPDLVPVLAIYFAASRGAVFTNVQRLRFKESDRIMSVINMLRALGGNADYDGNTLRVYATGLHGGIVNTCHDHRIAMAAAIAATVADKPVAILNAECVAKSYPAFWQDYLSLGGQYEQYIR